MTDNPENRASKNEAGKDNFNDRPTAGSGGEMYRDGGDYKIENPEDNPRDKEWQDRGRINVENDEPSPRKISGIENELEEEVYEKNKNQKSESEKEVNKEEIKKDVHERESWIRGKDDMVTPR